MEVVTQLGEIAGEIGGRACGSMWDIFTHAEARMQESALHATGAP